MYFNTTRGGIDITLSIFAVFFIAMFSMIKVIKIERRLKKIEKSINWKADKMDELYICEKCGEEIPYNEVHICKGE